MWARQLPGADAAADEEAKEAFLGVMDIDDVAGL